MRKLANILIGLGLLALPAQWVGAQQATFSVDVTDTKVYAKEVLGADAADAVVDYDDAEPKVTLEIRLQGGAQIGDAADIEFSLVNAKFASNVRLGSLDITTGAAMVRVSGKDDGVRDESSVTFRIEASQVIPSASTTVAFAFGLPELTGLNPTKNVTATVAVYSGGGSGWISSDASGVAAGANTGLEDGVLRALGPMPMTGPRPNKPIVSFVDGLAFAVGGSGSSRMISLAADRTRFVADGPATLGTVTVGLNAAVNCEADPLPSNCILQRNGDPFSIARRQDGEGNLVVTATGDFRTGDTVWLDADGNRQAAASEMLALGDDGAMSGTFDLADLAGNAAAARGTLDREEGLATRTIYYQPNGEDGLRPSEFRTRASVDFSDDGAADKPAQESRFSTVYAMVDASGAGMAVEATRTAQSVPALTAVDVGNVRIKCEVSSPCVIHLECDDVNGETWFAELDEPVPGRSTLHLTASDIAEALGIAEEDGWDDSLSCRVLSSRDISLQVLTRTGGVLVNHTYVEND